MGRLLVFLILCSQPAFGAVVEVCNDCSFNTLSAALTYAQPHDTIFVDTGRYECENLEIHKPITLLGKKAVLDGNGVGYIISIKSDSVNIRGFEFVGAGKSYTKDFAAIYLDRAKYFRIHNNVIKDPFFGILVEKSHHGEITQNQISGHSIREDDSGNGIHLWHCSNVLVSANEISNLRDGIYFEFVEHSTITDNFSHNNIRYGLHFMFSNHDVYINNEFRDNGAGVAVMFSKFITMERNKFVKNWGTASYGLLLKEIYDAEVKENLFFENTIAIFVEGSTRVNYVNNTIERNGWAVKVSGGCYNNIFEGNNFVGNSFDVSFNAKMNDNVFLSNYWSEYNGYDLDHDGVGDVPHRPVKLFSYIVNRTPETVILLRSLFIDILNFSEKVSPVFTPDELVDAYPQMKTID